MGIVASLKALAKVAFIRMPELLKHINASQLNDYLIDLTKFHDEDMYVILVSRWLIWHTYIVVQNAAT